jgi:signal transduction histidine kinase
VPELASDEISTVVPADRAEHRAPAEEQLEAIMAVSRAVAEGGALPETLDHISEVAANLLRARAAAIILRSSEWDVGLAVAGSFRLTPRYAAYLNLEQPLEVGHGPSGLAVETGVRVAVGDMQVDPIAAPWGEHALREGFRSMISIPLKLVDGSVIGVLNVYREQPRPWAESDVELLQVLADHAAIAVRTAALLDDSRRQVDGLSLLVRSLRAQGHEHSNRLHAIYGLLTLGEVEEARGLIGAVEGTYHTAYSHVTARIDNPVLAGFLIAEATIARHSGILISIDRRSRFGELPRRMTELDVVTLLGNLVHNAVEAVAVMPPSRRKVSIRLSQKAGVSTFSVRDWGGGIDPAAEAQIFDAYHTTKPGHSGIGLSLVRSVTNRASGRIFIDRPRGGGVRITVEVPA